METGKNDSGTLPPNPKQAYGDKKPNLALVPPALMYYAALALGDGHVKYNMFNWRTSKVEALTYVAAAMRHLSRWASRIERSEPEIWEKDGKMWYLGDHPELAHAAACIAILADAEQGGFLIDNRPPAGPDLSHLTPPSVVAEGLKVEIPDVAGYMMSSESYAEMIKPTYSAGSLAPLCTDDVIKHIRMGVPLCPPNTAEECIEKLAHETEVVSDTLCSHCGGTDEPECPAWCPEVARPEPAYGKPAFQIAAEEIAAENKKKMIERGLGDLDDDYPPCNCGKPDQAVCEAWKQTIEVGGRKYRCVKARMKDDARFDVV